MKFRIGDIANGVKTNKEIIEAKDYVSALEQVIAQANLYCAPADEEANRCIDKINEFCKENNRLNQWWD